MGKTPCDAKVYPKTRTASLGGLRPHVRGGALMEAVLSKPEGLDKKFPHQNSSAMPCEIGTMGRAPSWHHPPNISESLAAPRGALTYKGWRAWRLAYNEEVAGSTPASPTNIINVSEQLLTVRSARISLAIRWQPLRRALAPWQRHGCTPELRDHFGEVSFLFRHQGHVFGAGYQGKRIQKVATGAGPHAEASPAYSMTPAPSPFP